jgi:hypothetical protein
MTDKPTKPFNEKSSVQPPTSGLPRLIPESELTLEERLTRGPLHLRRVAAFQVLEDLVQRGEKLKF